MINPILERELKTRMRTWKTPIMMTIYLGIIAIMMLIYFLITKQARIYGGVGFEPSMAISIYNTMLIGQFIILMFVVPILTATSISGERERQTLDLMLCSDISPWKIIFGKMTAALSFVLLLVFSAMPFLGISLLFGGVGLEDVIKIILYYMLTSIMVSALGLYCSTRFKRVITSIVVAYFIMGIMFVGTSIGIGVFSTLMSSYGHADILEKYGYEIMSAFLAGNPSFGLSSLYLGDFMGFSRFVAIPTGMYQAIKPWMVNAIFDVIATTALLFMTKRRLTKIK